MLRRFKIAFMNSDRPNYLRLYISQIKIFFLLPSALCTWLPQHFNLYLLDSIAMYLTLSMCLDDMHLREIITVHVHTEDTQKKILSCILCGLKKNNCAILYTYLTHAHRQLPDMYINKPISMNCSC